MQDTWHVLRWAWSAVVILYCVLSIVASKRLHGSAKKWNHVILIVMAVLIAVRIWIGRAFGGQAYRFAVLVVGIAAGVAAVVVAMSLIVQKPGEGNEEEVVGEDRIQSLKLN